MEKVKINIEDEYMRSYFRGGICVDSSSLGGCWENGERLGLNGENASLDWFIRRIVSSRGRNRQDKYPRI